MTRVLHVLDHSLPLHSGYTFRTRAILKAQQGLGLDVRGITGLRHSAGGEAIEQVDGLTFHRSPGEAWGPPAVREWREISTLAEEIVNLSRVWRPDVLHAHSPALCGMAAAKAARRLGLPLVYEIRAFWEDAAVGNGTSRQGSLRYRLTREVENRAVAAADAVITICNGLRDDLLARGVPAGKIGVVPNGVDLALFGNPGPRDEALARSLGLAEGPVVGFIGSFYDYEGLDDLVDAMPDLVRSHPQAKLLLVGGGPVEEVLRARAEASPVACAIHFAGRVPHHEVERYYSLCDVMVYPRKKSRLTDLVTPLKPLEAMTQGRIVAASDVGGHRELVTDGLTGALFPPDDPAACARRIAKLFDTREAWPAMREAGRAHVAAHHDWSRNASRYRDVYQALLERGQTSRNRAAA